MNSMLHLNVKKLYLKVEQMGSLNSETLQVHWQLHIENESKTRDRFVMNKNWLFLFKDIQRNDSNPNV